MLVNIIIVAKQYHLMALLWILPRFTCPHRNLTSHSASVHWLWAFNICKFQCV